MADPFWLELLPEPKRREFEVAITNFAKLYEKHNGLSAEAAWVKAVGAHEHGALGVLSRESERVAAIADTSIGSLRLRLLLARRVLS